MKLQKLHIKNFKSIVDLEIVEPNPFTVFVGPNGSGKSNIFEALEFINYLSRFMISDSVQFFGGRKNILNINTGIHKFEAKGKFDDDSFDLNVDLKDGFFFTGQRFPFPHKQGEHGEFFTFPNSFEQFFKKFSRIFIENDLRELPFFDDTKLNVSTSNLEGVLKRILADKREEIIEWLELLIPEFANIEIVASESGNYRLRIYEKYTKTPLEKNLISDGTYKILSLLTAVYQSDEPQFLCIEEPENGLHPQVIRELVSFFRDACEQKGHYIWLNTHSQTLVDCLTTDEIILVDKIKGETQIKQLKGRSLNNMPASELWLSGALGGGVTW